MKMQIFDQILAGLILFGVCALAYGSPVADSMDSLDNVQNDDDYQYSDDESVPSSNTKSTEASPKSVKIPFFKENNLTVWTTLGKNVTLECPANDLSENHVVLWYKGNNTLTTGTQVVNDEYALNRTNFALQITNATEANKGEYFCEVLPQKIRLSTTLMFGEHPIEAIIPESSKSSQESVHFKVTTSLITSSVIGIFLFLRI